MTLKFFITSLILGLTTPSFAQDVIQLTTGETISSKVLEISDTEVKYKKFSNLTGPTYTRKKTELVGIKYENGEQEEFKSTSNVQRYTTVPNTKVETKESVAVNQTEPKIVLPPANDGIAIAKVHKINGIDIYFLSSPLIKYTTVFNSGDLLSDADIKSILWGGLSRADVDDKLNKLVNAAYRKAQKEGKVITGLIYSGGNRALAINYLETEIKAEQFAKVNSINGVEIYAFAEPTQPYDVISNAKAKSGGFGSMVTYGIVNSNMDDDITKLVERLDSKKRKVDAIIYNTGKNGVGIQFKK